MTVTELYTSQEAYKRQCDAAKNARKTKANDGAVIIDAEFYEVNVSAAGDVCLLEQPKQVE